MATKLEMQQMATPELPIQPAAAAAPPRAGALDAVRVLATVAIVWFHLLALDASGQLFAGGQAKALEFWAGDVARIQLGGFFVADMGVQAFIYLSAFSLSLSALRRGTFSAKTWYRSRLKRIYPPLWVALLALIAFFQWWTQTAADGTAHGILARLPQPPVHLLWNAMGATHLEPVQQVAGAWWFVGFVLTFYLAFPLFWFFLARRQGWVLVCLGFAVSVLSQRFLTNTALLDSCFKVPLVDFLGSRMLELTLGAALAEWMHAGGERAWRQLTSFPVLATLAAAVTAAFVLWGYGAQFAPIGPIRGFLVFLLSLSLAGWLPRPAVRVCTLLAWPAYMVYLLHHPLLAPFCTALAATGWRGTGWMPVLVSVVPVVAVLFAAALPLQWLSDRLANLLFGGGRRRAITPPPSPASRPAANP